MTRAYFNPKRESDPYSLPDLEVFRHPEDYDLEAEPGEDPYDPGWYWWSCFPGCLPDGPPSGPFKSEKEALAAARYAVDDEHSNDPKE